MHSRSDWKESFDKLKPGFVVVLGEQPVPITVKDDNCLSMNWQ